GKGPIVAGTDVLLGQRAPVSGARFGCLMHIDFLLDAFRADVVKDAVVWQDEPFSYAWLLVAVGRWTDFLRNRALAPGTVVSLQADFSPTSITFLLFDHIGGVNTLLYVLSNAGCVVTVPKRSPEVVCAAIERHRVQLLPTSPTFINLLLMSEAYKRHDLSSLEMVTYGTEVMPETTLERFHRLFPRVRLLQ